MSRYIDRYKTIDALQNSDKDPIAILFEQPDADVRENVKGEWIYNHDETGFYKCSACGCSVLACTKCCPDCGAKMAD